MLLPFIGLLPRDAYLPAAEIDVTLFAGTLFFSSSIYIFFFFTIILFLIFCSFFFVHMRFSGLRRILILIRACCSLLNFVEVIRAKREAPFYFRGLETNAAKLYNFLSLATYSSK